MKSFHQKPFKFQSFELGILLTTILIALFCQYYFIFMVLCVRIIFLVVQNWRLVEIKSVQGILQNYQWVQHHRILKNSLQFMKCAIMIQRGYDSKSNTNIVLQDEKQGKYPFTNKELDLSSFHQPILKMLSNLKKIQNQKNKIIMQRTEGKDELVIQIKGLKDVFRISKQIDRWFEDLSYLTTYVKQRRNQHIYNLDKQVNRECNMVKKKISQYLTENNVLINRLRSIFQSYLTQLQTTQPFSQYQKIMINKSSNASLQPIINFISQCQNLIQQNKSDDRSPIPKLQAYQEQENEEQKRQEIIERPNLNQKKQFMKKLDSLLMIGLAKKRQQQFQQKMKQLQLEQPNNYLQ